MLRTAFVLLIVAYGIRHSLRGPFYAVLFYLWIAYFRPEDWVWGGPVLDLKLSLVAGVYTLLVGVVSMRIFRIDGRLLLLILFLTQSFASTMASSYHDYAWPYFVDFAKSTAITYLLAVLVTDVHKLRLVFLTIALSLGFEAAKQGWGQLLFIPGEKNFNESLFLGDNNGVAIGMFMLATMLIALLQTTTNKWLKGTFIFLIIGVLYRGISTYSRGGLLACAAMAGLYFVRSKRKVLAVTVTTVAAIAFAAVMSDAFWDRMSSIRLPTAQNQFMPDEQTADEASTMGRLHFWKVARIMMMREPVLGIGHNAFTAAYDDFDPTEGAFGKHKSVHSVWFGLPAELGFPGLILFLSILILGLMTCRQIRKGAKTDPRLAELAPYATAIQIGLITFSVGGAFVIFQYTEMLWHFLGLTIALNRMVKQYANEPVTAPEGHRDLPRQVPARGWA
jgi:putative inorganic carbon (HCO3(-)) transporter